MASTPVSASTIHDRTTSHFAMAGGYAATTSRSIRDQTLRCGGMFLDSATRAMGMTTAKWMQLPVHELAVSSLTPTQSILNLLPAHEPNATTCADPCIHVLRLGAALYVQDGHHRLARAQRAHQWTIQARVLDVTASFAA